jgi:hypothetical protein
MIPLGGSLGILKPLIDFSFGWIRFVGMAGRLSIRGKRHDPLIPRSGGGTLLKN